MSKLNGSWLITVHTYMGDMRATHNYTVEGSTLTGYAIDASNGARGEITGGVVEGARFAYDMTIKTAVGEMTNHLSGELGEDDTLRGQSSNPMGSFDFDGVRA